VDSEDLLSDLVDDRNRWRTLAETCYRFLMNRNHDTFGHRPGCKTVNFQNETCACGFSQARKLYQEAFDKTVR